MNIPFIHRSKGTKNISRSMVFLHRIGRDAYVDWAFAIAFAFILAGVLITIGFNEYSDVNVQTSRTSPPSSSSRTSIINVQVLHDVISAYDARAAERTKLQSGYSGPGDPSL